MDVSNFDHSEEGETHVPAGSKQKLKEDINTQSNQLLTFKIQPRLCGNGMTGVLSKCDYSVITLKADH